MGTVEISEIRGILADDFSKTKIDRIIMALKSGDPGRGAFDLREIRPSLANDFSLGTINRVLMTLTLAKIPSC